MSTDHPAGAGAPPAIEIRTLGETDLANAAGVLGRGMRDNPLHRRVFGPDAEQREAALVRLFEALLSRHHVSNGVIVGAFHADRLVGVCAMVQPGRCQPTFWQKVRLVPALLLGGEGLLMTMRVVNWTADWARRDPDAGHWHLGPVAVDRDVQRQGVGAALMRDFCARMDAMGSPAYLETDKPENVAFYERSGFQVIDDAAVLGVPCWFMVRTP